MMKIDITFNSIQHMLLEFAKSHAISTDQVQEEWALSYQNAFQEKFEKRINWLLEAMQLHKAALAQGDAPTARCGMLEANIAAGLISDDFKALEEDLSRALRLDGTILSENYTVPEHYGYTKR